MAKETKAARLLREENDRALYLAEQEATWPRRLMSLLQRAQLAHFELAVSDMTFLLYDRDDRDQDTFVLDLEWSIDTDNTLSDVERRVEWKEEHEREANRKFFAKQSALAKLSKEERELLGL